MRLFIFLFLFLFPLSAFGDLYTASKAIIRVTVRNGAKGTGVGSGVIVGSDGKFYYALTNAHVASCADVAVELFDAGTVTLRKGKTVMRDKSVDLAVIKIDCEGYNPSIIPVDPSFTMRPGDILATMGHPEGQMPTCYFCTFKGSDPTMGLYFTPPPKQGRSGSPMLSPDGNRVVGIVYGYLTESPHYGLAVPASVVADFVKAGMEGKKRESKWEIPKNAGRVNLTEHSILENPPAPEPEETLRLRPNEKTPESFQDGSPEKNRRRRFRDPERRRLPILRGPRTPQKPKVSEPAELSGGSMPSRGSAVKKCQYQYPFQYEPSQCPGGTCPPPPGYPKILDKSKMPDSELSELLPEDPIAVEIIDPKNDDLTPEILPDAPKSADLKPSGNEKTSGNEKPAEVPKSADLKPLEERLSRLEKHLADLTEFLKKQADESAQPSAFLDRTTISDGLESGVKDGLKEGISAGARTVSESLSAQLSPLSEDWKTTTSELRTGIQTARETLTAAGAELSELSKLSAVSDSAKKIASDFRLFGWIFAGAVILWGVGKLMAGSRQQIADSE